MRIRSTRLRHWLPFCLCALLGGQALAAASPVTSPVTSESSMLDINRYQLLYSATGDDRFLERMGSAGKRFEASLQGRQDADALRALWSDYQQGSKKLLADLSAHKLNPQSEMAQSLKLSETFDAYLQAHPQTAAPELADNLRTRALLTARLANLRKVDNSRADAEEQKIKALDASIQQQIAALAKANAALSSDLANRWHYLQISQSNGKLLLYPFNAQIESMLGKLQNH